MKRKCIATLAILVGFSLTFAPQSFGATKLTTKQIKELKYLVEEEKLARDVYLYLAENVTTLKFANIAKSEQAHMNLVSDLLKTYGLKNPTIGSDLGEFKNKDLQALYFELIKLGESDPVNVNQVGIQIEQLDINDLSEALDLKWPSDVKSVLERLLSGSKNHLAAFTS